jgi:DNA-binding MarR family transcriptional regulator
MSEKVRLKGANYDALIELLRTSEAIWESSRLFFANWDISPSQFNILNLLRDFPDGCSQTHLSDALIMHRSNVTGLVDRLEKRNLVERLANPSDRRAFCVRLTPKAEKLLLEILTQYHEAADDLWGGIGVHRTKVFIRELDALKTNAKNISARLKEKNRKKATRKQLPPL